MKATAIPAPPPTARYPRELEHVTVLRDGARVRIRPIRADDAGRLVELYARLSRETAYQRFFTIMKRLPPDWARILATVDYERRLALVADAETPDGLTLIGVARWEASGRPGAAEIALVVQDEWQGKGLGTILLEDLLRAAVARGIKRFVAWVLADNRRMLRLLLDRTRVEERRTDSGVVEVVFAPRAEPTTRS